MEISPEKKKLGLALLRAGRVCSPPAERTMLDLLFSRAALQYSHNPEPCPPWARVYFLSVEPAEMTAERTLSPFHVVPLGLPASVRDLLQTGSTFLQAKASRKIFIPTSLGLSCVLPFRGSVSCVAPTAT